MCQGKNPQKNSKKGRGRPRAVRERCKSQGEGVVRE